MTNPASATRRALAATLAALIAAPFASAQTDADTVRRLQEENARLRQQLAEFQSRGVTAPAIAPASGPAAPAARPSGPASASAAPSLATDEGVQKLTPFEVRSDKDYGYLKTNSVTATRIGMAIQEIPLSISVLSEEFIKDTGIREIQDVMRYTASAAGDTRMGVKPPGNSATPSGNMTLRGFPVSSRLRNGLNRYSYYNMDTVDRIEIIKGPAAVFFGQGFPGGVINYVTKQPQFTKLPTELSYTYGGNEQRMGTTRATLDHNNVLSKGAAMRLISVWDDTIGSQRFEYKKGFTVAPSMTLVPFASGKVVIKADLEYADTSNNSDAQSWIFPRKWFDDYKSPSAALIAAAGVANADAYRSRIFNNLGAWIADVRRVNQGPANAANYDSNNNFIPPVALYTTQHRGAEYNDRAGNRIVDEKFNNRGRGTRTDQKDSTMTVSVEAAPADFLDVRYTYTKNDAIYHFITSQAGPYADGNTMNFSGVSKRDDQRISKTNQLDLVFKKELLGIKHKVLVGGIYDHSLFNYWGYSGYLYTNIPGAAIDPSVPPALIAGGGAPGSSIQLQQLYSRTGAPLTAAQVFSQYDPALHPVPDINRITSIDRAVVDRYNPKQEEYYANYMATLFQDRMNLFVGFRKVKNYDGEQRVSPNPPWFNGFENLLESLRTPEEIARYGISNAPGSYHVGTYDVRKGDSSMYGLSYNLTKEVTLYATHSRTFLPNTGFLGLWDETTVRVRAAQLGLNPNTEVTRLIAGGANDKLKNEEGINYEFGVKTSLWNSKLVGTFSVFRLERTNEKLDDSGRQIDEPLNYTAPNRGGTFSTGAISGGSGVRWYSNSSQRKVEGAEAEVIWTPTRNYQMMANASWQWTAKTIKDPSILDPNTPGLTAAQKQGYSQRAYFTYDFRLPNVPEYRLNVFNKYTFTDGWARGLSASLGARYASVMNISNDINFNSKTGGLTSGDYVVFDGGVSFPWQILGYRINTHLQISNLTDKEYNEGSGGLRDATFLGSPPRTWTLTNSLRF